MAATVENKMSLFTTSWDKVKKSDITLEEYIRRIKEGTYQDNVIEARRLKAISKEDYSKYKSSRVPAVTASVAYKDGADSKKADNIGTFNGFIVIDIDDEIDEIMLGRLQNDKYTTIIHRSIGGEGVCIFVKVNPDRFLDAFLGLEKYYYETFGLMIDKSCKNPNRLRFFSWDTEILYVNGAKFSAYLKKEPKKKIAPVIVVKNDFDSMIQEATRSGHMIVDGYEKWLSVGFALASEFGEAGREYYHALSAAGYDYKRKDCDKQYNRCLDSNGSGVTIRTLFHYCKEAGVELYSQDTKDTITTASQYKRAGKKREDAIRLLEEVKGVEVNPEVVNKVFDSKDTFDKGLDDNSEMARLEGFVLDNYQPEYNELSKNIEVYNRSEVITDRIISQMYVDSKKSLDFEPKMQDLTAVLTGSTPTYNPIREFFKQKWDKKPGRIAEYIGAINSRTPEEAERNKYFFKKWFVGMVHNWICPEQEKTVSPLTLILAGKQHGAGKTSFFRNMIPEDIMPYYNEAKLDNKDKDSMFLMANNLVIMDDEFGGKAFKEDKAFKALSDKAFISLRRPYGRVTETFKRRAMLCGTTNEINVLKDATGNRRLIPIHVDSVDFDKIKSIDTVQMFLEGLDLYRGGFDWLLRTQEDQQWLNESSEEFKDGSVAVDLILEVLSLEKSPDCIKAVTMNLGQLTNYMAKAFKLVKLTKFDIKSAAVELNIDLQKVRKMGGKPVRGYTFFVNPTTYERVVSGEGAPSTSLEEEDEPPF